MGKNSWQDRQPTRARSKTFSGSAIGAPAIQPATSPSPTPVLPFFFTLLIQRDTFYRYPFAIRGTSWRVLQLTGEFSCITSRPHGAHATDYGDIC